MSDSKPCDNVLENIIELYDSNTAWFSTTWFSTTPYLGIQGFEDCDSQIPWVQEECFSSRPAIRPWTGGK